MCWNAVRLFSLFLILIYKSLNTSDIWIEVVVFFFPDVRQFVRDIVTLQAFEHIICIKYGYLYNTAITTSELGIKAKNSYHITDQIRAIQYVSFLSKMFCFRYIVQNVRLNRFLQLNYDCSPRILTFIGDLPNTISTFILYARVSMILGVVIESECANKPIGSMGIVLWTLSNLWCSIILYHVNLSLLCFLAYLQ